MNNVNAPRPVLTIDDLSVVYDLDIPVEAVKNVCLTLYGGEILGLAGESGCGKTTLAYALSRLHKPPARISSGTITFHDADGSDIDVLGLSEDDLRVFRWSKLSMVFQGAMNALNPVVSIKHQLVDVFTTHRKGLSRAEKRRLAAQALELVGVSADRLDSFPHELSGGMRQRVMIAMALLLEPQLMIMDEPTTALDVVVQRDILREIVRLRDQLNFAVVFITHDLPLLFEISDRIAVMLSGEVVELGTAQQLKDAPTHPYTQKLRASFPSLTGARGDFVRTGGTQQGEPR